MEQNIIVEEDTQHGRYLTFKLERESFGIEISCVKEIVGMQPITQMPEAPGWMKGIMNLRGRIIPVIDMRIKFGKPEIPYDDRTCIIVIDINEISVGLIVDMVSEVLTMNDNDIVPPPSVKTGASNRYIKAVGKVGTDVKLLLDDEKLFSQDELTAIQQ